MFEWWGKNPSFRAKKCTISIALLYFIDIVFTKKRVLNWGCERDSLQLHLQFVLVLPLPFLAPNSLLSLEIYLLENKGFFNPKFIFIFWEPSDFMRELRLLEVSSWPLKEDEIRSKLLFLFYIVFVSHLFKPLKGVFWLMVTFSCFLVLLSLLLSWVIICHLYYFWWYLTVVSSL